MTMTRMKTAFASLAVAGLALAGLMFAGTAPASASTLLFDQGNYTYDSNSNLDWLDVTATLGMSADDVYNNNGVNYVANGWRLATITDMLGLYQDVNVTLDFDGSDYARFYTGDTANSGISSLLGLLGSTFSDGDDTYASGWLRNPATGEIGDGEFETWFDGDQWHSTAQAFHYAGGGGGSDFTVASFLVRDHADVPVAVTPLPAALPMFAAATGLMGLMGWRRKKNGQA